MTTGGTRHVAFALLKGGSSKWVHEGFPERREFQWQEGYGAFSIGISQTEDTLMYIGNQLEHHRHRTYQEEFIAFLERHGIEYDPRYVFEFSTRSKTEAASSAVPTGLWTRCPSETQH
jgi:hypothetical protein